MTDNSIPFDLACHDVVECVTDYLDGALAIDESARVERHLATCDGCQTVLAQWRTVVELSGRLTERDVESTADPDLRQRLVATFRHHRYR